jgi:hypothetical protein
VTLGQSAGRAEGCRSAGSTLPVLRAMNRGPTFVALVGGRRAAHWRVSLSRGHSADMVCRPRCCRHGGSARCCVRLTGSACFSESSVLTRRAVCAWLRSGLQGATATSRSERHRPPARKVAAGDRLEAIQLRTLSANRVTVRPAGRMRSASLDQLRAARVPTWVGCLPPSGGCYSPSPALERVASAGCLTRLAA